VSNDEEKARKLVEMLKSLWAYYHPGKEYPPSDFMRIYVDGLADLDIEHIRYALNKHKDNHERGRFYPKIADIRYQLEPKKPTPSELIAMANKKDCPLGIIARIEIGHFNLNGSIDRNDLLDIANQVLINWDEIKTRALRGDYTDHEISIMAKHGVSPIQPLRDGLPQLPANVALTLKNRSNKVLESHRHKVLMEEVPFNEDQNLLEHIAKNTSEGDRSKLLSLAKSIETVNRKAKKHI